MYKHESKKYRHLNVIKQFRLGETTQRNFSFVYLDLLNYIPPRVPSNEFPLQRNKSTVKHMRILKLVMIIPLLQMGGYS